MGQMTIYLEDDLENKIRAAAKSKRVSQSKWISTLIKERMVDEWPQSIISCAGSWKDALEADGVRDSLGTDVVREPL